MNRAICMDIYRSFGVLGLYDYWMRQFFALQDFARLVVSS